ncbi:DUF3108 domain-containing protein [Salinispirillum sp. LH 10-3-1]|uniref:DUF3108 domain-containing protein n=1 Tax=Salinispirillum sp. LH 10-3-1 TaxID=2952525 RepID=A0AB38YCJ0_9GAMM
MAYDLQPFELELEGFQYAGVGIKVTGKQSLARRNNDVWRISFEMRGPFVRIEEWVDFRWVDGTPAPIEYRFDQRMPFNNESRRIRFEPDRDRIRVNLNNNSYTYDFEPDIFDPLSYTLLLLNQLSLGEERFEFSVIDRRNPRRYVFELIEETELSGNSAAIVAQRVPSRGITYIVFDTDWTIPTHFLRWRDGKLDQQIRAMSATIGGTRVRDLPHWPNPRNDIPS